MPKKKLIITIEQDDEDNLNQWASKHKATLEPWNLYLGENGYIYTDKDNQQIVNAMRRILYKSNPKRFLPDWETLDDQQHQTLLHLATESARYMEHQVFDDWEIEFIEPHVEHILRSRTTTAPSDPPAFTQAIRNYYETVTEFPEWKNIPEHLQVHLADIDARSETWKQEENGTKTMSWDGYSTIMEHVNTEFTD